jgi:hypothetical protein
LLRYFNSTVNGNVEEDPLRTVHLQVLLELLSQILRDPLEGLNSSTLNLGHVVGYAESKALETWQLGFEVIEVVDGESGAGVSVEKKPRAGT